MDDLISRQAMIDLWEQYHPYIAIKACEYDAKLRQLPSVQQERPTGTWILVDNQRREDTINGNYAYIFIY